MTTRPSVPPLAPGFAWVVWLVAILLLVMAEGVLLYTEFKRGVLKPLSLQSLLLPLVITGPLCDGVLTTRKSRSAVNEGINSSGKVSTYAVCNLVLVANAAILACILYFVTDGKIFS